VEFTTFVAIVATFGFECGTSRSSTSTKSVLPDPIWRTNGSRRMSGRIPPIASHTNQLQLPEAVVPDQLIDKPLAVPSKVHAKSCRYTSANPESVDSRPLDGAKVRWVSNNQINQLCIPKLQISDATKMGNSMVTATSQIQCCCQNLKGCPKTKIYTSDRHANKFDQQKSFLRGVVEASVPTLAGLPPSNVRIVGHPIQRHQGRFQKTIKSMSNQFLTGAVTVEVTPLFQFGCHITLSKFRRVTQEACRVPATRVSVTVCHYESVSQTISIDFYNFPRNNSRPILSGWITIESNKAKPLVAPSVCEINRFAGLKTSRRVPMDNNPAKIRGQVPRQLGIFDRRWSEPTLCTYEEQRPPTSSANALQTNQDGADKDTNTVDAHRSQPKGGRNHAAHLLAATNASQRWKAKSNRVPRHLEHQSPVRCPSLIRFGPHSLPICGRWQSILTKPSTVTEFASCSATYVITTTRPIITQMDLGKITNCTSGFDDLRVVNATNPSRYHAW
jgi:hypothetical protein